MISHHVEPFYGYYQRLAAAGCRRSFLGVAAAVTREYAFGAGATERLPCFQIVDFILLPQIGLGDFFVRFSELVIADGVLVRGQRRAGGVDLCPQVGGNSLQRVRRAQTFKADGELLDRIRLFRPLEASEVGIFAVWKDFEQHRRHRVVAVELLAYLLRSTQVVRRNIT